MLTGELTENAYIRFQILLFIFAHRNLLMVPMGRDLGAQLTNATVHDKTNSLSSAKTYISSDIHPI